MLKPTVCPSTGLPAEGRFGPQAGRFHPVRDQGSYGGTPIRVDRPMFLDIGANPGRPGSLKITGESIVRDYRNNRFGDGRDRKPTPAHPGGIPILPCFTPTRPHFLIRPVKWRLRLLHRVRAVNWDVALEYFCWVVCSAAILTLIGLFLFGPTNWSEFLWK